MAKTTPQQREEMVAIASMKRGTLFYSYPLEYVAALYGVSVVYVHKLVRAAGGERRRARTSLDVARSMRPHR